jgi:hypothetical protein
LARDRRAVGGDSPICANNLRATFLIGDGNFKHRVDEAAAKHQLARA